MQEPAALQRAYRPPRPRGHYGKEVDLSPETSMPDGSCYALIAGSMARLHNVGRLASPFWGPNAFVRVQKSTGKHIPESPCSPPEIMLMPAALLQGSAQLLAVLE